MTRASTLTQYRVYFPPHPSAPPVITAPGPFEGEPYWAPYFWEAVHDGDGQEFDDGCGHWVTQFSINAADIAEFPELAAYSQVCIWEDSDGFIHTENYRLPTTQRG